MDTGVTNRAGPDERAAGRAADDPGSDPHARAVTGIMDPMTTPSSSPRLVGRGQELSEIGSALGRARQGTSGIIALTGEAGIGKTRLLQEAVRQARSEGASSFVGGSAPYPYGPLVGILRQLRRELGDPRLQRLLTGVRRPLVRLVPGLEPGGEDDAPLDRAVSQAPLFEAVMALVSKLGEDGPLFLGMEDLHQADESTLDLIAFLAANLTTERALLVTTWRTGGTHARVENVLAEIIRHPAARRIELPPLSGGEVTELLTVLQQSRPTEEIAVRIARRSQGNPFYLEELLAAGPGDADLPHGLEELLVARLAGLAPETREVLRAASVLGDAPHDRLLRAIVDLPDDELRAGLQEAADHGLLVPESELSERYLFRHDLIREVVHRRLLIDQRQRLHAAAAEQLRSQPDLAAGGSEHLHAELGRHWHLAGEPDRAFTASVAASLEAANVHALSEALAHLQRAVGLWDDVDEETRTDAGPRYRLDLRCAELALLLGDPSTGLSHLDSALARPDVPPEVAAVLHARASYFLRDLARAEEARERMDRALAVLPDEPSRERAETLARAGGQALFEGRPARSLELSEAALEAAREVGDRRVMSIAHNYRGCSLQCLGHEQEGIEQVLEALSIAQDVDDLEETKRAYINSAVVLVRSGRFEEAAAILDEALSWAREHGIGRSKEEGIALNAVEALIHSGRWREADDRLSRIRSVVRNNVLTDVLEASTVAMLRIRQDDLDAAHRMLDRVPEEVIDGLNPEVRGPVLAAQAELALAEGRHAEVRDLASQARDLGRRILRQEGCASFDVAACLDPTLALGIRSEVEAAIDTQDTATSEAERRAHGFADVLAEALEGAPEGTHVHDLLAASLALGEAELTRLDGDPAPTAWTAAVDAAVRTGIPFREAYARFRLAEALLEDGDRQRAVEEIEAADRIAERLGAELLRREIGDLARRGRLGLEVAHRAEDLGADLTPRQHDVLELLVRGHTNRQIGEELYISEKTVERHVTSILSTLQVDNRTEAAAVARERQLVR